MAYVKGSTRLRGYGYQHQQARTAYLANWQPGDPCARCGQPMWGPATEIHLGHTDDRTGYIGLEHAACNTADGAKRGNEDRPRSLYGINPRVNPVCRTCGESYNHSGKECPICGRHYHPTRHVQYTCSRSCGLAYKRLHNPAPPMPACEVCGKPCEHRQHRICGAKQCRDELRARSRKTLTCQRCGKQFEGRSAKYCSGNCAALAYYYAHRGEVLNRLAMQRRAQGMPGRTRAQVTADQSPLW